MSPYLQQQLRECIIHWRHNDNLSVAEIANLAGCGTTTVYDILKCFRETGKYSTETFPGHPRILNREDIDFITSLNDNPAVYLDEIQQKLEESQGIHVSLATLSHMLQPLSLSRKKISKAALEWNNLLQAT